MAKNKTPLRASNLAIFLLIVVVSQSVTASFVGAYEGSECFPIKGNSSALLCRSIPDCSRSSGSGGSFRKYKTIIFDLENESTIRSRAFYNCSFEYTLTLHFKAVQRVASYAFDSVSVARGQVLNVKLDGSGLNMDKTSSQSRLVVSRNAFNNIVLASKAKLDVFVKNYERAHIRDTLVANMKWQNENSEININVNSVDLVWFKPRDDTTNAKDDDLKMSDSLPVNFRGDSAAHFAANNISYSLLVDNANQVVFDSGVFANLQVNHYSDFTVFVQMAKNVFFNVSLFDSLMLGFYSR